MNVFSSQVEAYKDQVRQFSKNIIQLEKNLAEEQDKRLKLQTELDTNGKTRKDSPQPSKTKNSAPISTPPTETLIPVVPIADFRFVPAIRSFFESLLHYFSHELFAYKSRVQEQEQMIISLRRDLAGMTARLSDVQGEMTEKQKRALEKSEFTIRDQTRELNDTRLKLSKLSDIVDKQTAQIETLHSDLSYVDQIIPPISFQKHFSFRKSKVLANQYQLLVDQRQGDIDRLTKSLEQKNLIVERVEKNNQDEVNFEENKRFSFDCSSGSYYS